MPDTEKAKEIVRANVDGAMSDPSGDLREKIESPEMLWAIEAALATVAHERHAGVLISDQAEAIRVMRAILRVLADTEAEYEQVGVRIDDVIYTTAEIERHMPFATPPGAEVEPVYRRRVSPEVHDEEFGITVGGPNCEHPSITGGELRTMPDGLDTTPIRERKVRNLDTAQYRSAISGEGPLAYTWTDKKHRLVYDLCGEVEALRDALDAARQERDEARAEIDACTERHISAVDRGRGAYERVQAERDAARQALRELADAFEECTGEYVQELCDDVIKRARALVGDVLVPREAAAAAGRAISIAEIKAETAVPPSVPSEATLWSCSHCGPHPDSRANWCAAGCGSDYQRMAAVPPSVCPTCDDTGVIERTATAQEIIDGCYLGTVNDPCPNDAWHNRVDGRSR